MSAADSKPTSRDREAGASPSSAATDNSVGRELKRLRSLRGETQAQSAAAIGVSRANLTQWETGKYLPSTQNARQLDDYFQAGNALVSLIDQARSDQGITPAASAEANILVTAHSLKSVFQHAGQALADYLIRDAEGTPLGWRHNQQESRHHTPVSTAFGIKAMLVIGEPYLDLGALGESLLSMRADHGWRSRSGSIRAEVTATVLDALFRLGTSMPVDEALELADRAVTDFTRKRPYLLATMLQAVARLRPHAPIVNALIDDLLATRLDFDGDRLWPETSPVGPVLPAASTAHTARAVVALREALRYRSDRSDAQDAVDAATQWLIDRPDPDLIVSEALVRPRPDGTGTTHITIRHFTAAWVIQALTAAPEFPRTRLDRALAAVWDRYEPELGLWARDNGDIPIWMTLDAVTALQEATLTLAPSPQSLL